MLGLGVADSTAGFRATRPASCASSTSSSIRAEGYGFQIEMTYRAKQHGARITEVPISFVDREAGESKMSSFIVVEALGLVTWWGLGRLSAACDALSRSAQGSGQRRRPAAAAPGTAEHRRRRRRRSRRQPHARGPGAVGDDSGAVA